MKKAGKKSRTASGGTAVPSKVYQVAKNEELPVGAVPIDELADKAAARRRKGLLGADDEAQLADVDLTPDVAEDAVARKEAREAKPPKLKKKSKAAEIEEDSVQGDKTALKASKKKVKKRQIVLDDGTVAESGAADRTAYEEL